MKIVLLLLYVSVFRRPVQHKIALFENTLRYGRRQFGKKKNNEKAAIKSHKRASQTGNCGSVLVCNVNKGTPEHKKKDTGNYLSIKYCELFASVALWRTQYGCREQIFVAPNKVFLARATARADL